MYNYTLERENKMEIKKKSEIELIDENYPDDCFECIEIISSQDNELRGIFKCRLDDFSEYYTTRTGEEVNIVGVITVKMLVTVDLNERRVKKCELASYDIRSINADTPEIREYVFDVLNEYYNSNPTKYTNCATTFNVMIYNWND